MEGQTAVRQEKQPMTAPIDQLVQAVRQSRKYGHVSEEVIRRIGLRELAARRSLKAAVAETKSRLHQVAGAYLDSRPRYAEWLKTLREARENGEEAFRHACLAVMQRHASTQERAPSLPEFYAATLGALPPIRSVLDIACGLNPLALPWMPLSPDSAYFACDIHLDMIAFLQEFFSIAGVRGEAEVCDVLTAPPTRQADVALLLKILPLLDQWDRSASRKLLQTVPAKHLLVSFPTRSLGGRSKQMALNYEARFHEITQGEPWQIARFVFPNELCFLITK
jgi:16S rRNA (guanine(1405)-N(7))-methyltransferase